MIKEQIEKSKVGLRFNAGKPRWELMQYEAILPMIRVLEFGAQKYSADNWKKGIEPRSILACMQRHLAQLMDGETHDKESGLPHVGHILCNAMFFSYFTETDEGKAALEKMRAYIQNLETQNLVGEKINR